MCVRDDERAQTVQVGAILLLGTLVVALSVYQVTSVPGQNAETEFTHNQRVHEQLQEVRAAILETAAEGTGRSATVALGAQYRDRIVAVNPGPPSGALRTVGVGDIAIANAVAAGGGDAAPGRDARRWLADSNRAARSG